MQDTSQRISATARVISTLSSDLIVELLGLLMLQAFLELYRGALTLANGTGLFDGVSLNGRTPYYDNSAYACPWGDYCREGLSLTVLRVYLIY